MRDVDINYLRHRPSLRLWHITTRTQTIMENGVRVFSWPHHVRVTQTYSAITFATMRMGNCIRRSLASDESYHPYRDTEESSKCLCVCICVPPHTIVNWL